MIYNSFQQLKGMNVGLGPFLQPEDSPVIQSGANSTYVLGSILKDPGYYRIGDELEENKSPTGHYNFRQTNLEKELVTINNTAGTNLTLKYNNAGTWTDIVLGATWDGFENADVEMEAFLNYCFFVGYDANENVFLPKGSLTGTTFSTSTNCTDMWQAKYIIRYRDRLYLINCFDTATAYPFRVMYSNQPSAGALTWTPASNFLDVDYSEELRGASVNWDQLWVFTESSAYMYNQSTFKKQFDTGCSAHRTIQNSGPYMFWANYDGVWRGTGGQPENIGQPVGKFIYNGDPRDFFAVIVDEEYRLYIGDVTVDGVDYVNTELIFNMPTQTWRMRENYHTFTTYAKFMDDEGIPRVHLGTTTGEVFQKSKYYDDTIYNADGVGSELSATGYAIHADIEFSPVKLGDMQTEHRIKTLTAYAEKAQGVNLSMRVLDKNLSSLTPYKKIGQLTKYINPFDVNVDNGVLLQLRLSEYSKLPFFNFYGFELSGEPISKILKPLK